MVPFFEEESVVSRFAVTKEMFDFELENFEVSEQASFQINTGSFQTDVFLQSSNILKIAVNSLYSVYYLCGMRCKCNLCVSGYGRLLFNVCYYLLNNFCFPYSVPTSNFCKNRIELGTSLLIG